MKVTQHTTAWQDGAAVKTRQSLAVYADDGAQERCVVNIYPGVRGQRIDGFGGAITASVGAVLERLPPETAQRVIDACYGAQGNRYNLIRTHLDSCDFSPLQYCADGDAGDETLCKFSIEYDAQHIIPWILAAYKAAGKKLPVLLCPWSPPAYMKTNGERCHGGHLKPEYYPRWAAYICKYIQAYAQKGVWVAAMSIQNEPNAAQSWDSCLYTAEEEKDFLHNHLCPALRAAGLGEVDLYIWDHNKERLFDRALAEITPETADEIAGLAFHWYSGDHFDALQLVRRCYPDKKLLFSEGCIEYSRFDKNPLINAQKYAHDMLGNFSHGMSAFMDWNICLDEQGGPNHVGNYCEAPIHGHTATGALEFKLSYEYIGHCSRYIAPGAWQIAATRYDSRLPLAAFENPNGERVVVMCNETPDALPIWLRCEGAVVPLELAADTISTIVLEG